nr:myosin-J heavy chain-like isoform X1 [Tanacetum cinerariifolium]
MSGDLRNTAIQGFYTKRLVIKAQMSADVARSHDGDSGGEDRPFHTMYPAVAWVALLTEPNLGGRAASRLNTRDKTRNLSLKEITDTKGPVPIQFELRDKQTVMPLGVHAAHWSSYIREVIRGVPLYYPSWLKIPKKQKAALIIDIGTQFDLRPHMKFPDWTEINVGIQQHLQKAYNTNKAAFKAQHWVIDLTTETYNVEKIRRARPENITASEWDKYIQFWNDPRNIARAAQNRQNRAKSTVISRQGSRSLARLRDEMEYPSLIDTFFVAHTVNGEFLRDEDRRMYEEMRRLEATGTYTDDEINRLAKWDKQQGHIPGVGRVLPARATASPSMPAHKSTLNCLHKNVDFMMSLFKSESKYSDMFSQFEPGGASGSGGCGDEEEGVDDQDDEDEDGDGDT